MVPTRRLFASLAYLFVGVLLGTAWVVAVSVGIVVLLVLAGGLVGAPVVIGTLRWLRGLADLDRRLTNRMLGLAIPQPLQPSDEPLLDARERLRLIVGAPSTWRAAAWLALRLALALAAWTLAAALVWFGTSLALAPFTGALAGAGAGYVAAGVVALVAVALLTAQAIELSAEAHGLVAAALLGPSAGDEVSRLRARTADLDLRARLARDLHDSVGHSVTATLLQASAARRVIDQDPAFAARALEAIEDSSRAAVEELDRVLGVLRDGHGSDDATSASLARLDDLFDGVRTAGTALTVERRGDLDVVPPEISREAFRIVQEGLTNVLRHASGAETTVLVELTEQTLVLSIENRAGVALEIARTGGGQGIRGIAERVGALGGVLVHGPSPDGGFQLRAELPLGEARRR
jgi:signal transduction histidine kinase